MIAQLNVGATYNILLVLLLLFFIGGKGKLMKEAPTVSSLNMFTTRP